METNQKETNIYDYFINESLKNGDFEWAKQMVELKYRNETKTVLKAGEKLYEKYAIVRNGKAFNVKDSDYNGFCYKDVVLFDQKTMVEPGESIVEYRELNYNEKYYILGYIHGRKSNMWNNLFFF